MRNFHPSHGFLIGFLISTAINPDMNRIDFRGRIVDPITSEAGQKDYYEHLNHWRVCFDNANPLIVPTREDAKVYMRLLEIENK